MSPSPFSFAQLLRSATFWVTAVLLGLISAAFTFNPLTARLGFDYSLFFGAISTILLGNFAWAAFRMRSRASEGPSFLGTVVQIALAAQLALVLPLLVIALNAFRVRNCDLQEGFAFFALMPMVGAWLATGFGVTVAVLPRRKTCLALLYVIPLGTIAWAIFRGLQHPPIFAYGHFFGYYPGTIYDELRQISTTLLLFRWTTLVLGLFLVTLVGLLAGRGGLIDTSTVAWRDALIQRNPKAMDGSLQWGPNREAAMGTLLLALLALVWLTTASLNRYDIGYIQTNSSIQEELGGRYETTHFIIYYDRDHITPKTLRRMARDSEFRYHQLSQFFGHEPIKKIEIYWFSDVKQKARLMGAAYTMIARPWAYQFYIHGYGFPHGVLKHEMAHVFSAAFGAGPLKLSVRYNVLFYPALIEGVAVAADWVRGELTPHEWSRAMLDLKVAPDPAQILGPTGFFKYSGWTAYTIAGSFSRYLIDTYGMKKYKQAYGRATFQETYQKPLATLSKEWKTFLRTKIKLGPTDKKQAAYRFKRFRSIFVRTCPHTIAALSEKVSQLSSVGAFYSAIKVQRQVCKFAPRAHQRMRLLNLYLRSKNYREAQALVDALMRDYPSQSNPIVQARIRNYAGLLAYRKGRVQEAQTSYKQATQLQIGLGSKRHALVMEYAMEHPSVRRVIMNYIHPPQSSTAGLLNLQAAALQNPNEPMLAYLLGRRHYFLSQYKKALPLLRTAQKGLTALPLRTEILRLRGRCHFDAGNYSQAAQRFTEMSQLPLPSGLKRQALDWKQRSLWEQQTYQTAPSRAPLSQQ
ncbi:MAG: tetratricopeptide repeat protein [Deltaproteobacteria bacterium]|nr:MAG: tetratricopeptide repeat protein [Deltaproteobacteria bacterium]